MARSEDAKTPLGRFSYTQFLFEPNVNDSGVKQWQLTILFPKEATDLSALEGLALAAAKEEWGDKAVNMIKEGTIKSPFLDGDGKQGKDKAGEPKPGYPGHKFIRCTSGVDYRPKIVNQKLLPIVDKAELYSGCYGYAVVNAYTWENAKNGKGVSFGISLVQKAKDGESLGGGGGNVDPNKFFDKIEDEGDAPAETKSGKGAAGLFG